MAKGQFVISALKAGEGEASRSWGNRYRCGTVFEKVNAWLRAHGVEGNKAIHTLRKEVGAIVATRDDIFAASHFLRHADIAVTAAHYADKKTRTVIDMGALLGAGESKPANVIPMAPKEEGPPTKRKHAQIVSRSKFVRSLGYGHENLSAGAEYQSKLDPASILQSAREHLLEADPEAFKELLALGAGLRRGRN